MSQAFKDMVGHLYTEWRWKHIASGRCRNLIYLSYSSRYRRDMKISQRIGKTKFKFQVGQGGYNDGQPLNTPRFCLSAGTIRDRFRVSWMVTDQDDIYIRGGSGRVFTYLLHLDDVIEDPLNIDDQTILFLETMYPGLVETLPKLEYGLDRIDQTLKERFR